MRRPTDRVWARLEAKFASPALGVARDVAVPRLETSRLRLRAWTERDLVEYKRMIDDPQVMRYMGKGPRFKAKRLLAGLLARVSQLEARRALARLVDHWSRHGLGEWAVEEKATGALVGQVGFTHLPGWVVDRTDLEIGWILTSPAWGKGFATEAAHAALDFGFTELGLERVISTTLPDHQRSRRVMERLGLSLEGQVRWQGHEFVWYGIDRSDWDTRQRASGPSTQVT